MSSEAMSESLQFAAVKRRAVASRSYRTRLPASNGLNFAPGGTVQFDLPANLAGTYVDMSQCYLKFKVNNDATVAFTLDRAGAYGFIRRLQISTAGAQISDLDRYNVLAAAMIDQDTSLEWRGSHGKTLIGTETSLRGELVGQDVSRTYCLPIILNPLAQTTPHRMIPCFSLSALTLRWTMADIAEAVFSAGNPGVTFTDVEMVCMLTELSAGAQAMVDSATGGRYDILATSWAYSGGTLAAGVTSSTSNLGYSFSSLERVVFALRPQASQVQGAYSLGNRATANLSEYNLLINSQQYPAQPIRREDKGAEALGELLISDHSLLDWRSGSGFTNGFKTAGVANGAGLGFSMFANIQPRATAEPAYPFNTANPGGTTAGDSLDLDGVGVAGIIPSNIGTFLASIELESAISNGKSSHIYSGVSTLASTVQLVTKHSAAVAGACSIDAFANFTILMSLNMRGTGVFSVSV
jgi:hypothetical protein